MTVLNSSSNEWFVGFYYWVISTVHFDLYAIFCQQFLLIFLFYSFANFTIFILYNIFFILNRIHSNWLNYWNYSIVFLYIHRKMHSSKIHLNIEWVREREINIWKYVVYMFAYRSCTPFITINWQIIHVI